MVTAISRTCLLRLLNQHPKLRNTPNPGALLLIPPLGACQVNLKNVPAQCLLPERPRVIYQPSAGLWPHSDTQEAVGCLDMIYQRSSLSMLEFTALCHWGTTDTFCSCPSFQKYNLLLVFYCQLSNSQASLHLTLQKKSPEWIPEGAKQKLEFGVWEGQWGSSGAENPHTRVQHVAILSAVLLLI